MLIRTNIAPYLGVVGVNGFLVDLKTINPVKAENSAQADNIRQNLSLILKYRGISHIPTSVTAFKQEKRMWYIITTIFVDVHNKHNYIFQVMTQAHLEKENPSSVELQFNEPPEIISLGTLLNQGSTVLPARVRSMTF